jgi:hypothetical protein
MSLSNPSISKTARALPSRLACSGSCEDWLFSKALAAIRDELASSARRTESKRSKKPILPPRSWALVQDSTKVEIEQALLATDVFPRCALLLSIFEGMSLPDAVILLGGDRNLVRKAQVTGLREFTCNLARMNGWVHAIASSAAVCQFR